jgi:hypothetical protein
MILKENDIKNVISEIITEMGNTSDFFNGNLDFDELDNNFFSMNNSPKKIIYNTIIEKINDNKIGIKLYNTYIITISITNNIILNTDGFKTNTTISRINEFIKNYDAKIMANKKVLYLKTPSGLFKFFDGIMMDQNGSVLNSEEMA